MLISCIQPSLGHSVIPVKDDFLSLAETLPIGKCFHDGKLLKRKSHPQSNSASGCIGQNRLLLPDSYTAYDHATFARR